MGEKEGELFGGVKIKDLVGVFKFSHFPWGNYVGMAL